MSFSPSLASITHSFRSVLLLSILVLSSMLMSGPVLSEPQSTAAEPSSHRTGHVPDMAPNVSDEADMTDTGGDAAADVVFGRPYSFDFIPSSDIERPQGNTSDALDAFFNRGSNGSPLFNNKQSDHNADERHPFSYTTSFNENRLTVTLKMQGKSYIYRNSVQISSSSGTVSFVPPTLPPAQKHTDALGQSEVYFNEVSFEVDIVNAHTGDPILIAFQGCDEAGICYPPEQHTIHIPYDMALAPNTPVSKQLSDTAEGAHSAIPANAGEVLKLLDTAPRDNDIKELLNQHFIIGLLLCFILGIGLDLTPCVLPMLPIFSAMLIGTKKRDASKENTRPGEDKASVQSMQEYRQARRRHFKNVVRQNIGYASGLSLTYMVLGLIFSSLGASFHAVLQSPWVTIAISVLLVICALACTGLIEIKVPQFITGPLHQRIAMLQTTSFTGAFALGALSALIASPCTSAPLAGAMLFVMQNGNIMLGSLSFLAIGLGMATPLLLIGIFGARVLQRSGMLGDLIKRVMAVVLIITAFAISHHLLGRAESFVGTLMVYVLSIYIIASFVFYVLKRHLRMTMIVIISVLALGPTYLSFSYFETNHNSKSYEKFYRANSINELNYLTKGVASFVVFSAEWCTNCKYMDQHIYSQEPFISKTDNMRLILIDITRTEDPEIKELISNYDVIGVPFFVTLNPRGHIVQSQLGLTDQETVMQAVDTLNKLNTPPQKVIP